RGGGGPAGGAPGGGGGALLPAPLPPRPPDTASDEPAPESGTGRPPRPGWWPVAVFAQVTMTLLQVVGVLWLLGQAVGVFSTNLGVPLLLVLAGLLGGPCVGWSCRMAARGPARRYGQEAERRLRDAAAACGRARVLDPVAAELLRYREVREQYVRVAGGVAGGVTGVNPVTGVIRGAGVAVATGAAVSGAGVSGTGVAGISTTRR
ncbi:hypothetical protein ABZY90_33915, partial [Streptomyces sp. NPDC006422]